MAQAVVEKNMKTFPLSEVLHVTVTKQIQIQFINKPAEKAISDTFVNFTLQHWISFITVARPRIRSAIREGIQDTFLYHGNSKVAKVLQRSDTNTYQVHLMTFTVKGSPKRDFVFTLLKKNMKSWRKLCPK